MIALNESTRALFASVSATLPNFVEKNALFLPIVGLVTVWVGTRLMWTKVIPTYDRLLNRTRHLHERMMSSSEHKSGLNPTGFELSRTKKMSAIGAREIEMELLNLLEDCRKIPRLFVRPNIVFVFDELDKIAPDASEEDKGSLGVQSVERDLYQRKNKVDHLLSALKSFITHGKARFFFIGGREMLDSYHGERGSPSSLYESLFNRTFEVPSLLSDSSDHNSHRLHSMIEVFVCRKLMDKDIAMYLWLVNARRSKERDPNWSDDINRKLMYSPFCLRTYYHYLSVVPGMKGPEARRIVLGLRHFIQFLALHSWGNPKRLVSLFEQFTKPRQSVDWRQKEEVAKIAGPLDEYTRVALQFGIIDQQRIILASNIYTQLYHALGRQLSRSSDKLIVSTFAALQYILKLHRFPFSRYHLERMAETLNVYRATELNSTIDLLLSKVLRPQIRLIRNSHHRYRFNSDFEDEMRYISRVSDSEAAAFNFTLDASASVKAHFLDQLRKLESGQSGISSEGAVAISGACLILGDLYAQEQAEVSALNYYQKAIDVIDRYPNERLSRFAHIYVEALLRLGETFERRQRYDRAGSVYLRARKVVTDLKGTADLNLREALNFSDSKWDVFRQPFWAYWFLQLKRSPQSLDRLISSDSEFEYPFSAGGADAVNFYRAGKLAFYYGDYVKATRFFLSALKASNRPKANMAAQNGLTEKIAHRSAHAYLGLANTLCIRLTRTMRIAAKMDCSNSGAPIEAAWVLMDRFALAFAGLEDIQSLRGLIQKFEKNGVAYLESLGSSDDEASFEQNIDVALILGMMAHAAQLMTKKGLTDQAAAAYLAVVSVWGMFSEYVLTLNMLLARSGPDGKCMLSLVPATKVRYEKLLVIFGRSESWIVEARLLAAENITAMHAGSYGRFLKRWIKRDVRSLHKKYGTEDERKSGRRDDWRELLAGEWNWPCKYGDPIEKGAQKQETEEAGPREQDTAENEDNKNKNKNKKVYDAFKVSKHYRVELKNLIATIFPSGDDNPSEGKRTAGVLASEPNVFQRSMAGQDLINFSVWEYLARRKLSGTVTSWRLKNVALSPTSIRSLVFSHWLAGRRALCTIGQGETLTKKLKGEKDKSERVRERVYDECAGALHNFHLALYYIRQLSGNDQDMMFPPPALIYFDLWQLLHALVVALSRTPEAVGHGDDVEKLDRDKIVSDVEGKLSKSKLRRHGTPANLYNYDNVKLRTITELRDIENMGDTSYRARSEVLKTRSFLADDYEDSRFHMDWTLVQMYGPLAGILRCHVEHEFAEFEAEVSTAEYAA